MKTDHQCQAVSVTDPRLEFLRTVPIEVCLNWINDSVSDDIAMTSSSFAIGMSPLFRKTQPIEMFDLCVARIRENVVANGEIGKEQL